jgi:metal-sulfur cluster biosynthetic enzyme
LKKSSSVTPPPKARVEASGGNAGAQEGLSGRLSQRRSPQRRPTGAGGDLQEAVIAALKEIFDPEIPVNIYDLGLIYNVEVNGGHALVVTMTLTTPHCPVAESMPGEVELRVARVPGVGDCRGQSGMGTRRGAPPI